MKSEKELAAERTKGTGFSDWEKATRAMGDRSLAQFIHSMDPGNTEQGNAHSVIARNLAKLGLPIQTYASARVGDFASNPRKYFDTIPDGDYYFASIRPGMHLAHESSPDNVVRFVEQFIAAHGSSPAILDEELYISHNGEPVMSGHIVVKDDGHPNTILAEFTNDNFNLFHRGFHTPEIVVQRSLRSRLEWKFRGSLEAGDSNWRSEEKYLCNGGVYLSRPEMAERIYDALSRIPQDDGYYLPGYYEVLLEKTADGTTRTAFIEANIGVNA